MAAALANPGIVLKRLHGKSRAFAIEPEQPAAPRPTARQKQARIASARAQKRKDAEVQKARRKAESAAKDAAKDELAAIEQEEAELRTRRRKLQKKFHLRSVG